MSGFAAFLAKLYPGSTVEPLSITNNAVYLVTSAGSRMVAKHVTDSDIPVTYLAETNDRLADHLPTQKIVRVCRREDGDEFDAMFSTYVEGRDLASLLASGTCDIGWSVLADYFCRFLLACRRLPPMYERFGMSKRGAPIFDTHRAYLEYYGKRYWHRVRPFYAGTPVEAAVDAWLDGGLASAVARRPADTAAVPIDANLKNFVVTPDGRIVLLNLPIVGVSTPAHAIGAISVHLRHHDVHDTFVERATALVGTADADLVPQFEIWQTLGLLSFYAVREPHGSRTWRGFASPVALYDDFRHLVETHLLDAVDAVGRCDSER
jgi:hypothetical protein